MRLKSGAELNATPPPPPHSHTQMRTDRKLGSIKGPPKAKPRRSGGQTGASRLWCPGVEGGDPGDDPPTV